MEEVVGGRRFDDESTVVGAEMKSCEQDAKKLATLVFGPTGLMPFDSEFACAALRHSRKSGDV